MRNQLKKDLTKLLQIEAAYLDRGGKRKSQLKMYDTIKKSLFIALTRNPE